MSAQRQKSILSQVTLDTSKINTQSLSTSILPPLHTGESSYLIYKHKKSCKTNNRPLPFGSTSSRVTSQLEPKFSSHIVSYQSIQSKFKDISDSKISPFGTSESRFKEILNNIPGPGLYESAKIESIKNSAPGCQFSKQNRDLQEEGKKLNQIGPGSYEIREIGNPLKFRQKIAEKYREQKKKYNQSKVHVFKKDTQQSKIISFFDPNLTKNHQNTYSPKKQSPRGNTPSINTSSINRFILKENTLKYVKKSQKENIYAHQPPCSLYKNFTYNFVEKTDDAFASYLPKDKSSPGPGYYSQAQNSKQIINQSFNFKSRSARVVFPSPKVNTTKQKPKLSQLL